MLNRSVVLIGMPGSGKSTVGKSLADRLGTDFCDTDTLIMEKTGETLQDTINSRGREYFLKIEHDILMSLSFSEPKVISTGGSVVLHEDAMSYLKANCIIVFLDADLPLIKKRLWNLESRGIVFAGTETDIAAVYRVREPMYYKYSDIRVHIRNKQVGKIVNEILSKAGITDRH